MDVLTGLPNHPDGIVPDAYRNKPRYFSETLDGIAVHRHPLFVTANKGRLNRLRNLLSFAYSVGRYNRPLREGRARPDVVVASSPNFFCGVSGWLLARKYGAKFVFEVRDLWPAIFVQMGILKPGLIFNLLERLEMFLYRKADAVVTVTRSFARNIAGRGITPTKLDVVFNGVSDADVQQATNARLNGAATQLRAGLGISPLTKVVLYIGNHGEAQALTQVVDAARLLSRRTDTVFLMVGSGAEKTKLQDYARGVPNIQFLPSVPHAKVWEYYVMADINVVCLKNIPDFAMFIPSKMFEIMAAESCAVAGLQGEGAELMKESGCALVVESEAPERMAEAIAMLLDDPARRAQMAASGKAYVTQNFLHSRLAAQYLAIMQKLLKQA